MNTGPSQNTKPEMRWNPQPPMETINATTQTQASCPAAPRPYRSAPGRNPTQSPHFNDSHPSGPRLLETCKDESRFFFPQGPPRGRARNIEMRMLSCVARKPSGARLANLFGPGQCLHIGCRVYCFHRGPPNTLQASVLPNQNMSQAGSQEFLGARTWPREERDR